MAPRTPQPLLTALAEHPRQGTPHRGELTRSIEAADDQARDRLSDDPDAVYDVWKCLRTVRASRYFKNTRATREARKKTDPSPPPTSRAAGTRPQAVVVHAEPRPDPPPRAAAPAAVHEVRDTTPPPPTPRLRLPLERALTTRDGRPASRPSRDRLNVFKDYSPADGGDVIKLIHVVYKSFSEHVMDAARRGSLTVRPEVFLDVRHESASFFHARARVFFFFSGARGSKNEERSSSSARPAPPRTTRTARTPSKRHFFLGATDCFFVE